jgi:hypothetical protein
MPEGREYAYGAGPGGGLGNKIGPFGSPLENPGYDLTPGGGASQKGGEPNGPFGSHQQSKCLLPIVTRDSLGGAPQQGTLNLGSGGKLDTPMDTSTAMPGVTGESSGTGPISGGGSRISTPLGSPWGDMVG